MNRSRYKVEFTIQVYDASLEVLKDTLEALGSDLSIEQVEDTNGKGRIVRVCLRSNDPHLVFDACAEFGRLKSVKINEGSVQGT